MRQRHPSVLSLVIIAFALLSAAPAFAQKGDEEPSRHRKSATLEFDPALEAPPLRQTPSDQVAPSENAQPVVVPLPDDTPLKKAAQPVSLPLANKPPPKKIVQPVVAPPRQALPDLTPLDDRLLDELFKPVARP